MEFLLTFGALAGAFFGFLAVFCKGQELQMTMKEINRCPGLQHSKLAVGFEKLTYSKKPEFKYFLINGFVIVRRDIANVILELEISRCVSEDLGSCRSLVKLNCTNMCDQIGKENMIWTTVIANTKGFPNKCPIYKGSYEMVDVYLDMDKAMAKGMKLPPGKWMATLKFFDKEEILLCHYLTATIKFSRKRLPQT